MDTIPSLKKNLSSLDKSNPHNYGRIYSLYKRLANGYRILSVYLQDDRFTNNSDARQEYFNKAEECTKKENMYRTLWLENKHSPLAQLVEQNPVKVEVLGSFPRG